MISIKHREYIILIIMYAMCSLLPLPRIVDNNQCLASNETLTLQWAIPDKFCPPPSIEDVSATYEKSLEFLLLFYKFFLAD